jgi:hypothetical protein
MGASPTCTPAGVTHVRFVLFTHTTSVQGMPPIVTVGVATNPVPTTVMAVPPSTVPLDGTEAD